MINKKGFTLIELLIVVIIIGILATTALPQYTTTIERIKVGKAKSALAIMIQAQKMRYADQGSYITATDEELTISLGLYIDMDSIVAYTDWDYMALDTGTCAAIRTGGGATYNDTTVVMDLNGVSTGGSHPLD